jgi:ferricrocin synthase
MEVEIDEADKLSFRVTYHVDVLPTEHAEILLRQFEALIHDTIFFPESQGELASGSHASLLSMSPAKYVTLASPAPLLHELVECSVAISPEKKAFEFATDISHGKINSRSFTYRQLDDEANRIANLIKKHNIEPGTLVGICFNKCPEASFAILGILKAGCAYVAVDPGAPLARKSFILQDSHAAMVLTAHRDARLFYKPSNGEPPARDLKGIKFEKDGHLKCDIPFVYLDEYPIGQLSNAKPILSRPIIPDDLCYCLYTSGTTGTPKGCLTTHENAVQAMRAFSRLFEGHWDDKSRWLQFASFHFDVSVLEQYWSWSERICVISASRDVIFRDLAGTIRALGITHIDLTPSLALLLQPEDVPSLCRGVFITGGEQLKQEILDAWGPKNVIYNGYGPTEATIGVTMFPRVPQNGKYSNIGPPFLNVGAYVLQPGTDRPVLHGAVGELCVAGKLVGNGYLSRPELTKEKFPFLESLGETVYRTGDLVRQLHDGSFDFLGRADDQVKLRGQRLEIGEINCVVKSGVSRIIDVATYVLKHPKQQREQLVCFFTLSKHPNRSRPPEISHISGVDRLTNQATETCRSKLPPYMVPTHFIPTSHIPLTANNKVDTKALKLLFENIAFEDLQLLSRSGKTDKDFDESERKIVSILSKMPGVSTDTIHRSSSIFELGVDSISVIRLARYMRPDFPDVTVSAIMKSTYY